MTVKEFKEFIEGLDDDAYVVLPEDGGYKEVYSLVQKQAMRVEGESARRHLTDWDGSAFASPTRKPVTVVVLR